MDVHERIREKMQRAGMSGRELARVADVPSATMRRYISGTTPIPLDRLSRIAKALHTTAPILAGYEQDIPADIIRVRRMSIPLVGRIAAGTPIQANETYDTYIDADSDFRCDYALIVDGDSMEPTVQRGDLVFVRQQPDVDDGQVAAVLIDDAATLKRIYHVPNGLTLVSDNTTKYPPRTVTMPEYDRIQILGLAVAFKRRI